jgi:hypothetical protein
MLPINLKEISSFILIYTASWISVRHICIKRSEGAEEYPTKIKRRKADWIGHIVPRNCLPKQVIKGNIEGRMEVT